MTDEEAQLLAELRAISSKSSAASRFSEEEEEEDVAQQESFVAQSQTAFESNKNTQNNLKPSTPRKTSKQSDMAASPTASNRSPKIKQDGEIPPWKRPKPPTLPQDTLEIKADDAAVTTTTTTTMEDDRNKNRTVSQSKVSETLSSIDTSTEQPCGIQDSTFQIEKLPPTDSKPTPIPKIQEGMKTKVNQPPKTFRGERGGPAEDAELLALLKAVSSQSKSRFDDSDTPVEETNSSTISTKKESKAIPLQEISKGNETFFNPSNINPPSSTEEDIPTVVTRDEIPDAIKSKDWKRRKAAYDLMTHILQELIQNKTLLNDSTVPPTIEDREIIPALEEHVVSMVNDGNAGALDSALTFTLLYADVCSGARRSEQASGLATQILIGPAFLSSRPSTTKLVQSLLIKLMEVGTDGYKSVHAVINVVIGDGLSSKKPKVVTTAVSLIVDAIKAFGAGTLPVANISSALPALLSHANGTVREQALIILVEVCRALGSKTPLQSVLDTMKPTLIAQLDEMLQEQPQATPPTIGLRSINKTSNSSAPLGDSSSSMLDIRAALDMGEKELRAKKFAARSRVNLLEDLKKTEYHDKIKEVKWSEKVAALDILLKCGGERPFKLTEPSAAVNYASLIHEMKLLLNHTHFAVNCKAMAVLGMLAEGAGDKLYPHLRPMVSILLGLSKDKKLSAAVGTCLDSFFGHVMTLDHLLEQEDAIPSAVNESLEKNALARKTALDLLQRCIERNKEAGPRGSISVKAAEAASNLARSKLEDADPTVRKTALDLLQCMLDSPVEEIFAMTRNVVQELETMNPRVFKSLKIKNDVSLSEKESGTTTVESSRKQNNTGDPMKEEKEDIPTQRAQPITKPSVSRASTSISKKEKIPAASSSSRIKAGNESYDSGFTLDAAETSEPNFEDSLTILSKIGIPKWEASEEDGGILSGLQSPMWQLRRDAIVNIIEFTKSVEFKSSDDDFSEHVLAVVKEYTKGFKEANLNVGKAIIELFIAVCEVYTAAQKQLELWICKAASTLAMDKLGDKKFSAISHNLLLSECVVRDPNHILSICFRSLESLKSPATHEEFMILSKNFCDSFGAATLGNGLSDFIAVALKGCESANVKVRASALAVITELYKQLGPTLKALVLSHGISDPVNNQLESIFSSASYDPKASSIPRSRKCVVISPKGVGDMQTKGGGSMGIAVPRTDLVSTLPSDCISRIGSKDGKNAWKIRKEAMEEVENSLQRCGGFVSTEPSALKSLLDLARALRERLSDSQMNLKPVAAKIISSLLISVDEDSQVKLGRIFYSTLINAAINDNKKVMRDAALEALQAGTTKSEIDGGGVNPASIEAFLQSLTTELNDSEYKAGGLPDVLNFAAERAEHFPKAGVGKLQGFETQFSAAVVACLTSAKSETRSAAEALLRSCVEYGSVSVSAVEKGSKLLLPAQQRAIAHIMSSLSRHSCLTITDNHDAAKTAQVRSKSNSRSGRDLKSSESIDSIKDRFTSKVPKSSDSYTDSTRSRSAARSGRDPHASSFTDAPRSTSRLNGRIPTGRDSLVPGKPDLSSINELLDDPQFNPLKGPTPGASSKMQRCSVLSRQRENWPEYPEEPTGGPALATLKKKWSQLIPSYSLEFFFPSGGIQKQEDAANGCYLLQRSIFLSKQDASDTLFIDQLDLVNKWLAFAVCSRDSPIGLGPIIDVVVDMISLMLSSNYQMNDVEAMVLLPYLVERAGTAKERFRDSIFEILSSFVQNNIYPASKFGPFICVAVIEKTGNAKTKVIAVRELQRCVEISGIDGIGKRGLTSTAKILSDEHVAEIKNCLLDLIETIIQKMDSDIQKYLKICTSSYLSGKARDLILERVTRHGIGKGLSEGAQVIDRPLSTKASTIDGKADGMPALKLNVGLKNSLVSPAVETAIDSPFTFSFQSKFTPAINGDDKGKPLSITYTNTPSSRGTLAPDASSFMTQQSSSVVTSDSSAAGASASLRERLKQIRDKHRLGSQIAVVTHDNVEDFVESMPKYDPLPKSSLGSTSVSSVSQKIQLVTEKSIFLNILESVDKLLFEPIPLIPSNSRYFPVALDGLRRIHASLTSTSNGPSNQSTELEKLKVEIVANMSTCVERLASILDFGFKCCHSDQTAGLSIPLLSVGIAALMAIFLDMDLAAHVTQTSLIHVLREASKGLLDPRLNATLPTDYPDLDDATCKKMAKAMNKLALQATSGTSRHAAFQALFSLQFQLCSNTVRDNISSRDVGDLNFRMSRIIIKLFNRLVKEEEEETEPFSTERIDLEATFCSLEDMLIGCYNLQGSASLNDEVDERMNPCISMARTLMLALVKARNESDRVHEVEIILTGLRLNSSFSRSGRLFNLCCNELDIRSHPRVITIGSVTSPKSMSPIDTSTIVSEGVKSYTVEDKALSQLLFAVGSADGEVETTVALNNLRSYVDGHPEIDFEPYLKPLSRTFRTYILANRQNSSTNTLSSLRQRLAAAANNENTRPSSVTSSPRALSKMTTQGSSTTTEAASSAAALRARLESVKKKYMS